MLNNLSVLKAENVIEGNMLTGNCSELAFADAEDLVTLGKCEVQFVIYHYHVILSHPLDSGIRSKARGDLVGNKCYFCIVRCWIVTYEYS